MSPITTELENGPAPPHTEVFDFRAPSGHPDEIPGHPGEFESRSDLARTKSTVSTRRKPVPLSINTDTEQPEITRDDADLWTEGPASLEPPTYILAVDPLVHHNQLHVLAPSYVYPHEILPTEADAHTIASTSSDHLPRYAEETQTEPRTLARGLWRWGWLCPLLWAVGMCILWIPLKPIEEERDAEKAQKLDEMIVILRETELKYAKRCLWAFLGFCAMITGVVVVAMVVSIKA